MPAAVESMVSLNHGGLASQVAAFNRDLLAMMQAAGARAPDLNGAALELAEHQRDRLGAVYDAARETQTFYDLIGAPAIMEVVRAALGDGPLHRPFQHCVFRMDLPGESFRSFDWHQDFPYNVLSRESLTVWIPLLGAGAFNGSVDLAPAVSDRLYPVKIRWKRSPDGSCLGGRDAFIDEAYAAQFEQVLEKPELAEGDFAVFGSHVVHRSGDNPGPQVRFSVQVRYGRLLDSEVVARDWANRRSDGFDTFKNLHPELIRLEETR